MPTPSTSTPSSKGPQTRLEAVQNHISPTSSPTMSTPATPASKPPITCHILDTTLGRPAASLPVTLTLHNPPSTLSPNALTFTATTNADGRVTQWAPTSPFSADALDVVFKREGDQRWEISVDTEGYWGERGIESFFEEVVVRFLVRRDRKGEHYHVPVLLGPFGYTTYRGS